MGVFQAFIDSTSIFAKQETTINLNIDKLDGIDKHGLVLGQTKSLKLYIWALSDQKVKQKVIKFTLPKTQTDKDSTQSPQIS